MGPAEVTVMSNGQPCCHRLALTLNRPTLFYRRCCSATQEAIYELFLSAEMEVTDSCGRPQASGAIHVGCTHDGHTACTATTRRAFFKAGVAVVGAGGLATIMDPRELFAQVRVFPPPPPAVSPIAGLMDTHVHTAPDVF